MRCNEQGFSLIELLIGLAIIVVVLQQYSGFQNRSQRDSQIQQSNKNARDQLLLSLDLIRKNMKSRNPDVAPELDAGQLSFQQTMADGSFRQVTVTNRCHTMTTESFRVVSKNSMDVACYTSLACKGLPSIEISIQSTGGVAHKTYYPAEALFNRALQQKISFSGLGLCFSQSGDSIGVHGIQMVHERSKDAPTNLYIEGMKSQLPIEQRNTISFLR